MNFDKKKLAPNQTEAAGKEIDRSKQKGDDAGGTFKSVKKTKSLGKALMGK